MCPLQSRRYGSSPCIWLVQEQAGQGSQRLTPHRRTRMSCWQIFRFRRRPRSVPAARGLRGVGGCVCERWLRSPLCLQAAGVAMVAMDGQLARQSVQRSTGGGQLGCLRHTCLFESSNTTARSNELINSCRACSARAVHRRGCDSAVAESARPPGGGSCTRRR